MENSKFVLFFDNSLFLKDNNSLAIEAQSFVLKENALKTIKKLKEIKGISFIVLWQRFTNICHIYKLSDKTIIKEIKKKMREIYKFKFKRKLVIKNIEVIEQQLKPPYIKEVLIFKKIIKSD